MYIANELKLYSGKRVSIFLLILISVCIGLTAGLSYAEDGIIVAVNMPPCAWADVHLAERIDFYAASINSLPIQIIDSEESGKTGAGSLGTAEKLSNTGRKFNGRYVIEVQVDEIDLEKRKVTLLPQAIFRYRVYAVLRGSLRIYDVDDARMISSRDIEYEIKAKDRWQFADDDEHDADLHIKSDLKAKLFSRLEDEAALDIHEKIKQFIKDMEIDI